MYALTVSRVSKRFGGIVALNGIDLDIADGEIFGLMGPNACGKTTLINVISGFYQPDSGTIQIHGQAVNNKPPYADCFRCLSRSFQIPKLWPRLNVLSNLMISAMGKDASLKLGEAREKALRFLDKIELRHLEHEPASTLSGGQSKLLETGRAMITDADVILLDEPFAGVAPSLLPSLIEMIKERAKEKTSFLVVSHIISGIVDVSDKVGVMSEGRLIAEGKASDVFRTEIVVETYLGGSNLDVADD